MLVFAVQFACHFEVYVIGTGSSPQRYKILDEFVDYKTQNLNETVGEVDLVLECVGRKSIYDASSVVKRMGSSSVLMSSPARRLWSKGVFVASFSS